MAIFIATKTIVAKEDSKKVAKFFANRNKKKSFGIKKKILANA